MRNFIARTLFYLLFHQNLILSKELRLIFVRKSEPKRKRARGSGEGSSGAAELSLGTDDPFEDRYMELLKFVKIVCSSRFDIFMIQVGFQFAKFGRQLLLLKEKFRTRLT